MYTSTEAAVISLHLHLLYMLHLGRQPTDYPKDSLVKFFVLQLAQIHWRESKIPYAELRGEGSIRKQENCAGKDPLSSVLFCQHSRLS